MSEHHRRDPQTQWPCPLCGADVEARIEAGQLWYAHCARCDLISLDPARRPLPLDEVVRYTQHRNDLEDRDYRAFLARLSNPMSARLHAGAKGLDFGCGPVPVLADILTHAGYPTSAYDPVFHPHGDLLRRRYEFVACSEVVEHFHDPASAFGLLGELLVDAGLLGIMTRFHSPDIHFATWWYRRDPTHVCFFSEATMRWIAARHGWTLEVPAVDIALFTITRSDDRLA